MVKTIKEPFQGIYSLPAFPVVLVTVGRNIMTAAAFHFYSFKPPCVMVGTLPRNLTCELIQEKGEFGINIPTQQQLDVVQVCGLVSGRVEDKLAKTGLSAQESAVIDSILIAECPISIECRVVHRIDFVGSHVWFIGQIEAAHIDTDYRRDDALMFWLGEYRKVGEILPSMETR